jgi:hypothetical protein
MRMSWCGRTCTGVVEKRCVEVQADAGEGRCREM